MGGGEKARVVETDELGRTFWREEAVRGLNLSIREGSVYGLLGPNGAGKTTTCKLLVNLLRPTAGRAQVLGVPSTRIGVEELSRIGYVAEDQELPGWMTVRELVDYLRPLYPGWDDLLCERLLDELALPEGRKIRRLSRGMRMKTAVLAALGFRPELLILDEPFSGLDPLARIELVEGLLELGGDRTWTVLLCSHDLATVEKLADRVGLLDHGELVLDEELERLQRRFREVEVVFEGEARVPEETSASWIAPRAVGPTLRFVLAAYEEGRSERELGERFAGARDVRATPMPLHEIYVAVLRARGGRGPGEEAGS